jgi:hypothetical protein
MSWYQPQKPWGEKKQWDAKPKKNARAYLVCEGCGHWVWEDRKVGKCYMCGGHFPGFDPPGASTGAGTGESGESPAPSPDIEALSPLLEAMGALPELQPFVEVLRKLVPPKPEPEPKNEWKESKQRVEKANKEVQRLEGAQKGLEDNIKHWEQKIEAAREELKDTKAKLAEAYNEQSEAQAEKRKLLEKGPEPPGEAEVPDKPDAEMGADEDQKQIEEAQRLLEAAKERVEKKKRDKLKADPQTLAGVAKKLAEDMANKKAKLTDAPMEVAQGDAAGEADADAGTQS